MIMIIHIKAINTISKNIPYARISTVKLPELNKWATDQTNPVPISRKELPDKKYWIPKNTDSSNSHELSAREKDTRNWGIS